MRGGFPASANIYQFAAILGVCFSFAASVTAQAGDLLRGGAPGGASPAGRHAGARGASAAAARARANSNDALSRTTMALHSVKAMQAAARALANKGPANLGGPGQPLPNVPNGLAPGGLVVSPSVPGSLPTGGIPGLWSGAKLPTQKEANGETIVTIVQEDSKALLTWETFNIGGDTTLRFDQSAGGEDKGKWIVFNKVEDPTGVPSQILGSIEAPGQVYVINRNGIIFGGSSQINTRSFVASTLPINDNLVGQGLLNNPDAQFLFSALPVSGGSDGTPAFFPTTIDPEFVLAEGSDTYSLVQTMATGSTKRPLFTYRTTEGLTITLAETSDYTLSADQQTATFTPEGLAKIASSPVRVTYTPAVVKAGNIVVKAGAVIKTPVSADGNGGRVMLVGANVTNAGTISTPAGQTILAAGQQVGVAAHASNDPSLRGLDVWVGAAANGTGTVTNSGLIQSLEGSVAMHGKAVNQLGAIESSTSVSLNGRIDLVASYGAVSNPNFDSDVGAAKGGPIFVYQHTGSVTFGENSVTRILPDYFSTDTVPGLSLPEKSQINVLGHTIHFGPDALVLAPSAEVSILAGDWPYEDVNGDRTIFGADGTSLDSGTPALLFNGNVQRFLFSSGQIYLDASSMINVAGTTDVFVPLTQNILDVEFRGAEFADSPLQRDGIVQATMVTLDLRQTGIYGGRFWMGTPLGDATGLAGLIQRNAAQLTAEGGQVTLRAGESVVVQEGATIDVSGGYFEHEAGMVTTSRLLQFGRLVEIADALPNKIYEGIYTGKFSQASLRWGVTETFVVPWMTGEHYQEAYLAGANGGALDITAPGMAIDGELRGLTVQGPQQRSAPPELSSLSFSFKAERIDPLPALQDTFLSYSPTPPTITFQASFSQPAVGPFALTDAGEPMPLREERLEKFNLSPDIFSADGFGHLSVENTDGDINIPKGVRLAAPTRGSLTLKGANITILGQVSAPSGGLSFTVLNLSPEAVALFNAQSTATTPPPPPNADRGLFTLGPGASLSTAGLIVNDLQGSAEPLSQPLAIDGGSISIQTYSANLAAGSFIDVSGGVAVSTQGAFNYGDGGDVAIRAGRDLTLNRVLGGELLLASTLSGYSGTTGGTLTLQASTIQIGGTHSVSNTLFLSPDFFRQGGFTSFSLTGIGDAGTPGISIAPGTTIRPVAENWIATLIHESQDIVLSPTLNPVGYRFPVNLSLNTLGADDASTTDLYDIVGNLVISEGVRISSDPGATVSFNGQTITLLGSVIAPGGNISLTGASSYPKPPNVASQFAQATVYIGPDAFLSTAGTAVIVPDEFGHRLGTLYPGGTISVSGNIIAEAGAVLDVSGTSAVFDLHPSALGAIGSPIIPADSGLTAPLWTMQRVPTRIDSDGGLIDLTGSEMLFSDATLLGQAGGPTAHGGTLSVASNRFASGEATGADINLVVIANGKTIASTNTNLGVGSGMLDASGAQILGKGYFAANRFTNGGFNSLDLGYKYFDAALPVKIGGNVQFQGAISIDVRGSFRIAAGGLVEADGAVKLTAAYLAIGQEFVKPVNPDDLEIAVFGGANGITYLPVAPEFGPGSLTLKANTIDVGTVSLQGIGSANFVAVGGDIRGNGTINIAGDLTLRAAQVYPTTLSTFSIFAYDHDGVAGSVTIRSSGESAAPLSAGGKLNIFASKITQGGVLRAPMGSITLGWDGTDFDPSDADFDTPFDPIARGNLSVPVSSQVVLKSGSLTSVSAVGMLIPFGLSADGSTWIDPSGVNVTVGGLPNKEIIISGDSITKQGGSTVDLRGGGELYAFRWIPGAGGSTDLLGSAAAVWSGAAEYQAGDLVTFGGRTWSARVRHSGESPSINLFWTLVPESYAVLPGFNSPVAPYAPFNNASSLGGEPGFVSNTLQVGDRVFLDGVTGLRAGNYTLLPSRYALLPGAFLITPTGNDSIGTITLPDGAGYTSGIAYNLFNRGQHLSPVQAQFEVASNEVIRNRVEFDDYLGNPFFTEAAARLNVKRPQELPMDGGHLALQGTTSLQIAGAVLTGHPSGGRGAAIDISSFADLYIIGGSGTAPAEATAVLNTSVLNSWHAESLLIGGLRRETADGTVVEVRTNSVRLDNAGTTLTGSDVTLAAKTDVTIADGSALSATGRVSGGAVPLQVSGDGTLVRVSADPGASIVRTGRTESPVTTPLLTIGADAQIGGGSVILDSTHGTQLDSTAGLNTQALTLGSGRISIKLPSSTTDLSGGGQLVLSGEILKDAQQAHSLTLTSYTTIDIYGAGEFGSDSLRNLSLQAGGITRGNDSATGDAILRADNILFANPSNTAQSSAPLETSPGGLRFDANTIRFGSNTFSVAGYETVVLDAAGGILTQSKASGANQPTFSVTDNLTMIAPVITGMGGSSQQIVAGGTIMLQQTDTDATVRGGLGSTLSFTGAEIIANSDVVLPSGQVTLRATIGDVTVGGKLDVSGTRREFFDVVRYSGGGNITLTSDLGDVSLAAGSNVTIAALTEADSEVTGNSGTFTVNATQGVFNLDADAKLSGHAGEGKTSGSFILDAGSLPEFSELAGALNDGGFSELRNLRVRTGDVIINSTNTAHNFLVSADDGDIRVSGTGLIDASGDTGGNISLIARGDVVLEDGAQLTVHARDFSSAGKGGEISLNAGAAIDGSANLGATLDIQSGATIDLGVDAYQAGALGTPGSSAFKGQFTGTLHLRAPRNAGNTDLGVAAIGGTITGASSILVEGYEVMDLTGSGGLITGSRPNATTLPAAGTVQRMVYDRAADFLSTANYDAMIARLLGGNTQNLLSTLVLAPGVELINTNGDLTIGSPGSTSLAGDWSLADFRFGPKGAAGVLTMRASGDIVINNSLSDGFTPVAPSATNGNSMLWLAQMSAMNANLPVNTQSWSFHMAAGSDLGAADFHAVLPTEALAAGKGSLLVGEFYAPLPGGTGTTVVGPNGLTANTIGITGGGTRYEVIRTGTGDIDIAAARDVQLRNQFSTIYTAGARITTPQNIFSTGDFALPVIPQNQPTHPNQTTTIGVPQQPHTPQWSMAGGNVTISAEDNIRRVTMLDGVLIDDSSRQLPNNWLYRRGYVNPATGLFGSVVISSVPRINDVAASTTWWIDFTNFFEGVGALGGGDVSLTANHDIANVDAVVPTNARMPGRDAVNNVNLAPDASKLVELGGGDLMVRAGNNIDGGVYYVERGNGLLFAGGQITTNETRSPSLGILRDAAPSLPGTQPTILDESAWLPTTLFVGKSFFDVSARGDVLLGPITNPFFLPQANNNKFWYKTYFNSYSADAGVDVSSFGGSVTYRLASTGGTTREPIPILSVWLNAQNAFTFTETGTAAYYQPWLRLAESSLGEFDTLLRITVPNLIGTAFAGDLKVVGSTSLFPSPTGGLEFAASGSIIGLNPHGQGLTNAQVPITAWSAATINVSDADPNLIPSVTSPLSFIQVVPTQSANVLVTTNPAVFQPINLFFQETGSYSGFSANDNLRKALHTDGLLHAGDVNPIRLYAAGGDISGLTLYAPKVTQIAAANDITDVSFYIQHVANTDISFVSAGRDIIPYNENTPLRSFAADLSAGNLVAGFQPNALAGDIQINGPGVLEVLAGRNVDLGTGPNFDDGTGFGITSVGNARNLYLPFDGADLVVMAGVSAAGGHGPALGLSGSSLNFESFVRKYLDDTSDLQSSYLEKLGSNAKFEDLSAEQQALVALDTFYGVLRDAGRAVNSRGAAAVEGGEPTTDPTGADPASTDGGTTGTGTAATSAYDAGFTAIDTLFGTAEREGDIFTQSREIRTRTGGAISVGAPGGGVAMASDIFGNPLTPPGVVTEFGGAISVFTDESVEIGQARIFTLRGGDIIIWSSNGDVAAGNAPKTVVSAPPTRVIIDVNSAAVQTDLGGLATGGGIGVLAAVEGIPPGDVDLIAPNGAVDAGDAGIRVTGNLNIAATTVLNASNIQTGGSSSGVPVSAPPAAPNIGALAAGSSASGAAAAAANQVAQPKRNEDEEKEETPSIIIVEVVGYGGGEE